MSRPTLDAVADVLDHELVDADGLPCGMVDDVVLEGQPGASLAIVGLLVGPGAWLPRTMPPLRFFAQLMFGRERVRVPWSAVRSVGERIVLEQRAAHYGLGRTDRRLGRWIARIPTSPSKVTTFMVRRGIPSWSTNWGGAGTALTHGRGTYVSATMAPSR